MAESVLTKGIRLARRGRYADAIRILQNEVITYRDSWRFFYTLGLSCLRQGDTGGAFDYFKSAYKIREREPLILLALGVLYMKRGESSRAVNYYLEVRELDPKNRIAKKALKVLRKYSGGDDFPVWLDSGKLPGLFPPFPKLPAQARNKALLPSLAAAVLLLAAAGVLVKTGVIPQHGAAGPVREGLNMSALEQEDREKTVDTAGVFHYVLTQKDVLTGYEKARSLFTAYRDEAAKVELNRILESNAAAGIKNKARLLMGYMDAPGFDSLKDRFSYAAVVSDPRLYRDCFVIWRGMAANIVSGEDSTRFDLLVGYDTRLSLEGIVPVTFGAAVPINTDSPFEILGRVSLSPSNHLSLEAVALHEVR
jgi:hypothetical protein